MSRTTGKTIITIFEAFMCCQGTSPESMLKMSCEVVIEPCYDFGNKSLKSKCLSKWIWDGLFHSLVHLHWFHSEMRIEMHDQLTWEKLLLWRSSDNLSISIPLHQANLKVVTRKQSSDQEQNSRNLEEKMLLPSFPWEVKLGKEGRCLFGNSYSRVNGFSDDAYSFPRGVLSHHVVPVENIQENSVKN